MSTLETWEKVIDPNYVSAELIGGVNAERVVTIKDIGMGEVFNSKTQSKETKTALFFEDSKPLVLNKTNAKQLRRIFPDKEPNELIGETIILYNIKGKFFGKEQLAIRIKENPTIACEKCGTPVEATGHKTVAEMINYSKKHCNGKTLCLACMREAAKGGK